MKFLGNRHGRHEPTILFSLLGAAGLLWAFVRLADEVAEGDTHAFDRLLLLALRDPTDPAQPLGPPWLTLAARDITSLGGYTVLVLITAMVLGFLVLNGKRAAALLTLIATAGGMLFSAILKDYFDRPRPDLVPHGVDVFTASFPSSHAMLSAVTYLTLGALLARTQSRQGIKVYVLALATLLTLLIGVSRVYLGVHWPSDVLAGWSLGAAWALLCWSVARILQRYGKMEPDTPPTT